MIIADTNVIISFLMTKGITEKIISNNPDRFVTPVHCYDELWEYRHVWNKKKLSDKECLRIIDGVKKLLIHPIPRAVYKQYEARSRGIIDDPDDVPLIALALAIDNEGIWTYNTKDFMTEKVKKNVKVLTIQDVLEICPVPKSE